MNYVPLIEPRLTPHRPASPGTAAEALVDWLLDFEQEAVARLERLSDEELRWTPHPDANDAAVTFWHVARWLDVLAAFGAGAAPALAVQAWERDGWRARTGYDPAGRGHLGLGTLTGYTPEEMRAVPRLGAGDLVAYLRAVVADLRAALGRLDDAQLNHDGGFGSPFQIVGSTLQGSFGHLGEVDALVALRARLHDAPDPQDDARCCSS
ncbi:MAG TPA: DinB family protein [Acidimicrobiales bacterium]